MGEIATSLDSLKSCLGSLQEMLQAAEKTLEKSASEVESIEAEISGAKNDKHKQTAAEAKARAEPTVELSEVRAALATQARNGRADLVKQLIRLHGADKLSEVEPCEYAAMLEEVRCWDNGS